LKSAEPAKPEPADADGGEVHLDQPNYETQEETGATTAPGKTRPQQTKAKSTKPAQTTGGAPRETQ
jgi:hypothetical protein